MWDQRSVLSIMETRWLSGTETNLLNGNEQDLLRTTFIVFNPKLKRESSGTVWKQPSVCVSL